MKHFKPIWYCRNVEDRLVERGIAREMVEEVLHSGGDHDYPGPLGFVWRERKMGNATLAVLFKEFAEFFEVYDAHRE